MRARTMAALALLSTVVVLAAGTYAADTYTPKSSDAFVKSIRSYPFLAATARREKIRAGVPTLARCMPSTEVRRIIGDPDFGYVSYRAGSNGQVPMQHIWHYVLEKKALKETEPSVSVVAWFDNAEKLQTVAVHGAPDIEASISRRNNPCT